MVVFGKNGSDAVSAALRVARAATNDGQTVRASDPTGEPPEIQLIELLYFAYRDFVADPDAVPATFYDGSSSGIWAAAPPYEWEANPAGTAAAWVSPPLSADTVVIGPGSVDLWVRSSAEDTDLEATLSEVRPDGTEVYVQSGWLRASRRALAPDSTEARPTHTHAEADAAPLPPDERAGARRGRADRSAHRAVPGRARLPGRIPSPNHGRRAGRQSSDMGIRDDRRR